MHVLPTPILTSAEMAAADRSAVATGTPGYTLMQRAATAVARTLQTVWPTGPVLVLAGPGKNGGDGWEAARLLLEAGREVDIVSVVPKEALPGDAALAADRWIHPTLDISEVDPTPQTIVIDALFGAGLSRPLDGNAAILAEKCRSAGARVLAVDVPSGLNADTGLPLGEVVPADVTVTFQTRKPGHLLAPGRDLCGRVVVADIGLSEIDLLAGSPTAWEGAPEFFAQNLPTPNAATHKYSRGWMLGFMGDEMPGASLLAAAAARRVGAGIVSLIAGEGGPTSGVPDGVLIERGDARRRTLLKDDRVSTILIGPGLGRARAAEVLPDVLGWAGPVVVDGDGLTSLADFAADRMKPFRSAGVGATILTPHAGEFSRLFPDLSGDLASRARAAAKRSGCIVVAKGALTVVAEPGGRLAFGPLGPPDLATAGSGDTLAGIIAGLSAQGMPAFSAAVAGVWLHVEAAKAAGNNLIAEDLAGRLPGILAQLKQQPCGPP